MDLDSALAQLGLTRAASFADAEAAYGRRYDELRRGYDSAPTDALRAGYARALTELDQAIRTLDAAARQAPGAPAPEDTAFSPPPRSPAPPSSSRREHPARESAGSRDRSSREDAAAARPPVPSLVATAAPAARDGTSPLGGSLSATRMRDLPAARPQLTGTGGSQAAGVRLDLEPGRVLAERFEIRRRLGAGGMGAVFAALDRQRGLEVALKVLLPELLDDVRARERFLAEARLSAALSHPGIVRVFDLVTDGDLYFLTMELLVGRNLRDEIAERRRDGRKFAPEDAVRIGRALCDALEYAHRTTIHRDLKPENVWLCQDGSVKLMDFGIARTLTATRRTTTGLATGTAYYIAPEQLKGVRELDGRADQYSLGVTLYELLTGELPVGRVQPVRALRPDVSSRLSRAIDRMLEVSPEKRWRDIAAARAALSAAGSRAPMIAGVAGGVVLATAAAVLFVLLRGRGEQLASEGPESPAPAIASAETPTATAAPVETARAQPLPAPATSPPATRSPSAPPKVSVESTALAAEGRVKVLKARLSELEKRVDEKVASAEKRLEDAQRAQGGESDAARRRVLEGHAANAQLELTATQALKDRLAREVLGGAELAEATAEIASAERMIKDGGWAPASEALARAEPVLSSLLASAQKLETAGLCEAKRARAKSAMASWTKLREDLALKDSGDAAEGARSLAAAEELVAAGDPAAAAARFEDASRRLEAATMATERDVDRAKTALAATEKGGRTALHQAAAEGKIEDLKLQLKLGGSGSVNAVDGDGFTPLHVAVREKRAEAVLALIDGGADLNAKDKTGMTALHWAVVRDELKAATSLLDHGASPNEQDEDGDTPLHVAARRGADKLVELLLAKKAAVNVRDNQRLTPLDVAVSRHGRKLIAKHGGLKGSQVKK